MDAELRDGGRKGRNRCQNRRVEMTMSESNRRRWKDNKIRFLLGNKEILNYLSKTFCKAFTALKSES